MTKCQESGCDKQATHQYRSPAGFKVPLCDAHYAEWEKYENKRTLKTTLKQIGKWIVRTTAILMILIGVLAVGFALYSLTRGTETSFEMVIGLVFTEMRLNLKNAPTVSAAGTAILIVGAALFYIGFMKMEHDLW